jgi:hypothetical protein
MEGFTRIGNDITWITNGIVQISPFHTARGPNFPTTYVNILVQRRIVFSSVCDWNLIMTVDNHPTMDSAMPLLLLSIYNGTITVFIFAIKMRC